MPKSYTRLTLVRHRSDKIRRTFLLFDWPGLRCTTTVRNLKRMCLMSALKRPSQPSRRSPLTRILALASITLGLAVTPAAAQSVVLQEPDFTGMFTVGDIGPAPVLRDVTRGWTYFASGNVEGVGFSQWLFRIGDSGLPDTQWRLPADFQITEQYLAPDGTPIVRAYVKNSPTYEKRWYRLRVESMGHIMPVEISNVADLPAGDSIDLLRNTGLEPRLLPLRDGAMISFEIAIAPAPAYTATYTLRKSDNRGNEQWSHVVGGRLHNLASDAQGNVYLLGETLSFLNKTGNLLRIRSDGSVDTSWSPAIEITSNVSSAVRVVADRIVIANYIGGAPPVNRLTTFDLVSGHKLVERYPQYSLGGIAEDGAVLSAHAGGHWALLDSSRNDISGDRVSVARVGTGGSIQTSTAWRGGYVIGGKFQYWFDGRLYRNLMRVDASFRPDPTWTPATDDAVSTLTTDRDGRLLVGSNSVSGAQARIQRFGADGVLDTSWLQVVKGDVYKLLSASDGMLFVGGAFSAVNNVPRNSLARFRTDGTLDLDWGSQPTWPVMQAVRWGQFGRDGVYSILDAGPEGIIFTWEDGYMNGSQSGVVRLSRNGQGSALALPTQPWSATRDPATSIIYGVSDAWALSRGAYRGTALVRLLPPSMAVDASWTTFAGEYGRQFGDFAYQTDGHVYFCRGQNVWMGMQLRRFDKISGREDPNWSSDETFLCGADSTERRGDGSSLVFSSGIYGPFVRYSTTASNTPVNVVEYYSRDAKRFFITGRPDEITQLDAMPTNFVRTGMTFAAETALVRSTDATRTAICRFYAPPAAGGSNTHFYGRDADCTLLKRFSTLRYEGYDFRAGVPINGACPTTLPTAVFRLFNNASASNNGNHRYVVSETRRNEMLGAGWLDEGVAFCTPNAVDSRSLLDVLR